MSSRVLAEQRAGRPHTSMFLRMLWRAAVRRRGRAASALLAMIVAATTATAMLNLYGDVQGKLNKEFRSYGANIVVIAKDGQALPADALPRVRSVLSGDSVAAPFGFVVARTASGQPVVVAGTDFASARKLNSWWKVSVWPEAPQQALVGVQAQSALHPTGLDLTFQGRTLHVVPSGTLQTGADEDSRIYISLADFESWTEMQPSTIEIAASGGAKATDDVLQKLNTVLPDADVHAVRRIVESESRVMGKTRATLLSSAVLIVLTSSLCVLATLIGWVVDRRRDFAIMKALGASERLLTGFFAAEAAALGAVGALAGYALGIGIAAWIGRANFNAPVVPRLEILPIVLLGAIGVALLSAIAPISVLRRVQPATILRGE
jgi:putative ABC transport system permease protein